ncbi:recombinase family protein [Clostridium scatologenes]|uniref:Resolvase domain n=1 Tax=Clostridium scatologenes TaxID=1548 RepID=A0A0E3MAR1_CLOSL|nr:recombinase family protein [Clostridium scatologenes]AKA72359.1 Resolvase domain [Clostridium scatologenes]
MIRKIRKIQPLIQNLPTKKRVAAYARVSSGKDEMLHSLSAQVSYYSNFIQKHAGWEYAGVYADEAITGTKELRPGFQKLLDQCRNGKIDMVITKSISRLARNTVTMLETVRELKDLNIDVYFEKENIHSVSGDGELMLTILASFAQEESRSVSENCKWRIRKGFANGELLNLRFMYGYRIKKDKIEIEESEAEIVRMIFKDYINGLGSTSIAKKLRKLDVKKLLGGIWNSERVLGILENEKYTGNALLQKKYVVDHLTKKLVLNKGNLPKYYAEGTHPPIIDLESFQKAQEILRENGKRNLGIDTRVKYAFTGKVVCSRCGKNYRHKNIKGRAKWFCYTYFKYGKESCSSKEIPEDILISLTIQTLGIKEFDKNIFEEKIRQIKVLNSRTLEFIFYNGTTVEKQWNYSSRSESWSEEDRQKARERSLEKLDGRS